MKSFPVKQFVFPWAFLRPLRVRLFITFQRAQSLKLFLCLFSHRLGFVCALWRVRVPMVVASPHTITSGLLYRGGKNNPFLQSWTLKSW